MRASNQKQSKFCSWQDLYLSFFSLAPSHSLYSYVRRAYLSVRYSVFISFNFNSLSAIKRHIVFQFVAQLHSTSGTTFIGPLCVCVLYWSLFRLSFSSYCEIAPKLWSFCCRATMIRTEYSYYFSILATSLSTRSFRFSFLFFAHFVSSIFKAFD